MIVDRQTWYKLYHGFAPTTFSVRESEWDFGRGSGHVTSQNGPRMRQERSHDKPPSAFLRPAPLLLYIWSWYLHVQAKERDANESCATTCESSFPRLCVCVCCPPAKRQSILQAAACWLPRVNQELGSHTQLWDADSHAAGQNELANKNS